MSAFARLYRRTVAASMAHQHSFGGATWPAPNFLNPRPW